MGLQDVWWWLRKKINYHPKLLYPCSNVQPVSGTKIRVDVAGGYFPSIRWAYTTFSDNKELAHSAMERILGRLGTKDNLVFYVDGHPAEEKRDTHDRRRQQREKAIQLSKEALNLLEGRIKGYQRVRRQHFQRAKKNINSAFHWTFEDRSHFVDYLQQKGYHAIMCDTEADPRIAADSQPVDVIVSRDSDFVGYSSVRTIWRPVGHATENKYLIYCKDDILSSLKLTDTQLTALACVVKNDYDRNVPSCAVTTSYYIIKDLGSRQGKQASSRTIMLNVNRGNFNCHLSWIFCLMSNRCRDACEDLSPS